MEGVAFCPAHITGFFRADIAETPEETGSVGAGFSIKMGVKTTARISEHNTIDVKGVQWSDMTRYATELFYDKIGERRGVSIRHELAIPTGYGLGSSGAIALSTLYALNQAFNTKMDNMVLGQMAHRAELHHKTGLGDVLAAFYGGFEVRTRGGAPGYGKIKNLDVGNPAILIVCLAPSSTGAFLQRNIQSDNNMIETMLNGGGLKLFQDMSMSFAKKNGVITDGIRKIVKQISQAGSACGVAMVGETVFCMTPKEEEEKIADVLRPYDTYRTRIDTQGARVIQ